LIFNVSSSIQAHHLDVDVDKLKRDLQQIPRIINEHIFLLVTFARFTHTLGPTFLSGISFTWITKSPRVSSFGQPLPLIRIMFLDFRISSNLTKTSIGVSESKRLIVIGHPLLAFIVGTEINVRNSSPTCWKVS